LQRVLESGETRSLEFTLIGHDNTPIAAESSISMIPDTEGKAKYFLAITRDIRERKAAEKREKTLAQLDKMVSLGTLVSGIAHELNNPAGFIMVNAESFERVWKDVETVLDLHYDSMDNDFKLAGIPYNLAREEIKELIVGLKDGANRIKVILQDLKDYSRPEDSIKKAVDINRVLNSSLTLTNSIIKRSTDNLDLYLEENLPILWGSPQKLEQVFINLIQNACDALDHREKGIVISSRFDTVKNQIEIKIKDEGIGISSKDIEHILDPFYTTKRSTGGTGLGLPISQQIIKKHAGEMIFESEPGKGTTVTLYLPAAAFSRDNHDNKKEGEK